MKRFLLLISCVTFSLLCVFEEKTPRIYPAEYLDFVRTKEDFIQWIDPIKNDIQQMLKHATFQSCAMFSRSIYNYYDLQKKLLLYMKSFIKKNDLNLCVFEIERNYYLLPIALKEFFIRYNIGYENNDNIFILNNVSYDFLKNIVYPISTEIFSNTYEKIINAIEKSIKNSKERLNLRGIITLETKIEKFIVLSIINGTYNYTEKKYNKISVIILNQISALINLIDLRDYGLISFTKEVKEKSLLNAILDYLLEDIFMYLYLVRTKDDQYYLIPAQLVNDYPEKFDLNSARVYKGILIYDFLDSTEQLVDFMTQLPGESTGKKELITKSVQVIDPRIDEKCALYEQYIKRIQHIERNGITVQTCKALINMSQQFYDDYHYEYDAYLKKIQESNNEIALLKFYDGEYYFVHKKVLNYIQKELNITDTFPENQEFSELIDEEFIKKVNKFELLPPKAKASASQGNSWYNTIKSWGSSFWQSTPSFFKK